MSAAAALALALAELANANRWTPCQADAEPFVSENYRERRRAAEQCGRCPVIEPCRTAGQDHDWHVWGGIDRTKSAGGRANRRGGEQ